MKTAWPRRRQYDPSKVSKYLSVDTVQQSRTHGSSKTLSWEHQIFMKSLYVGKIQNNLNIQTGTPSNFKCKMWQKFPIYMIFSLWWEDSGSQFLEAVQFCCHLAMAAQFLWKKECPWSLCKCTLALLKILSSAIKKNIYIYYQYRTSSTH